MPLEISVPDARSGRKSRKQEHDKWLRYLKWLGITVEKPEQEGRVLKKGAY